MPAQILFEIISDKVERYKDLEDIKYKYMDKLRSVFGSKKDHGFQSIRSQIENLLTEKQRACIFREDIIEQEWREMLRSALPVSQKFNLLNPKVLEREDENFILIQLRYILKQSSS